MSYQLQSEPFSINCIVFTLTPHRFLKYTHTKQSFRPDDQQQVSDLVQRSILGNLMPEAMICFLENYGGSVYVCALYVCISMCSGADKFSEIFLGEFDTPEAIWSSEMRWVCLCYSCSRPATPTLHCAGG